MKEVLLPQRVDATPVARERPFCGRSPSRDERVLQLQSLAGNRVVLQAIQERHAVIQRASAQLEDSQDHSGAVEQARARVLEILQTAEAADGGAHSGDLLKALEAFEKEVLPEEDIGSGSADPKAGGKEKGRKRPHESDEGPTSRDTWGFSGVIRTGGGTGGGQKPRLLLGLEGEKGLEGKARAKLKGSGLEKKYDVNLVYLGKRHSGLHDEAFHVRELSERLEPEGEHVGANTAVVPTQDNCIFCYGLLEMKRVQHGKLREHWPQDWENPDFYFKLDSKMTQTFAYPKIHVAAQVGSMKFAPKTYWLETAHPKGEQQKVGASDVEGEQKEVEKPIAKRLRSAPATSTTSSTAPPGAPGGSSSSRHK